MAPDKKNTVYSDTDQNHRVCLHCGFPNRATSKRCMYCDTSIVEETGVIPWLRQTYQILLWRWQLKKKRMSIAKDNEESSVPWLKYFVYFVLGALLSVFGVYLFTISVSENSFSNALIATLLLFYGFFTLRGLFSKK